MPRPILATIHADALRHNLERARRAAQDARVWAVVKANAYGHGIERVFDAFRAADGFALLDLAEAERVRALGWRGPILLLEGVFEPRDLELCSRLSLWHTVHCDAQIDMLAAHKTQVPHRVFLKMNSGMNRLGFAPERFRCRLDAPERAAAGRRDLAHDALQRCRRRARHRAPAGVLRARHAGPAGRTLARQQRRRCCGTPARTRADWVRPGILLYGSAPDFPAHDAAHWQLQPGMTLSTRLIGVQKLQPGDAVGYGSSFVADAPLRIGIAAVGYADGYPRHCTHRHAGAGERRAHPHGRPRQHGHDHGRPDAGAGRRHSAARSRCGAAAPERRGACRIDEVAQAAGTVGYELMCALAPRVPVAVEADAAATPI